MARWLVEPHSAGSCDLEDLLGPARLGEPVTALQALYGLVVIEGFQRQSDLLPILRVLADRRNVRARFLYLGGAAGASLRQSPESLAGHVEQRAISGIPGRTRYQLADGIEAVPLAVLAGDEGAFAG